MCRTAAGVVRVIEHLGTGVSTGDERRSRAAEGWRSEPLTAAPWLHSKTTMELAGRVSDRPGCAVGSNWGGCVPCNTAPAKYIQGQ